MAVVNAKVGAAVTANAPAMLMPPVSGDRARPGAIIARETGIDCMASSAYVLSMSDAICLPISSLIFKPFARRSVSREIASSPKRFHVLASTAYWLI